MVLHVPLVELMEYSYALLLLCVNYLHIIYFHFYVLFYGERNQLSYGSHGFLRIFLGN